MPDLPARFAGLILAFAPLFVHRSWRHAQVLLIGAILTPGRCTVASVLRKPRPTFADALAAVRYAIWRERTLATSPRRRGRTKPRFRLPAPWAYALCNAA